MRTAILGLIAAAALAVTADTASAGPPGRYFGGYNRGYGGGYRGGYYGGYRPYYGYSNYGYSNYGYGYRSGFGLSVGRPGGFGLSIIAPSYGNGGYLYQPYRYGYGGYAGRGWWGW